jgi:hypothetical protein
MPDTANIAARDAANALRAQVAEADEILAEIERLFARAERNGACLLRIEDAVRAMRRRDDAARDTR